MTPICALTSGVSSESSRRPTVVRSRWPCSMLVNLARLVFSQSCSVLTSVVSLRLHSTSGFHVTGTVGVFSAAAAAARLLHLSAEQTAHALGIAATQAAGLYSARKGAMT